MKETRFLEIDGSLGEGGGSILRLGAGFSVLFNQPIRIRNIRANRPKSGLRLQHLKGLRILSELTNSILSNCEVGTKEITLIPEMSPKERIEINLGTAANIGLLLQPIQIACLGFNQPEKIEIIIKGGGTFGKWAPSLNYLKDVTYQIFNKSGLKVEFDILKHGFYPKGGAHVKCVLFPPKSELKPILLTELGNVELIQGEIICTTQLKKKDVAERIRISAQQQLKKYLKMSFDITYKYVNSLSPGVGLHLKACSDTGAILSSGTVLGEKTISSEELGKLAAKVLIKYIQNEIPVDNYLSDQLIPLMGFVNKPSRIKVLDLTKHTMTNLELIKLFLKRTYKIIKENKHFIIEFQ